LRDAVGEGVEPHAFVALRVERVAHLRGDARKADRALRDVVVDEAKAHVAEHLRGAPFCGAPNELELHRAIARDLISLRADRVRDARGVDVDHPERVAHDIDRPREPVELHVAGDRHRSAKWSSIRRACLGFAASRGVRERADDGGRRE